MADEMPTEDTNQNDEKPIQLPYWVSELIVVLGFAEQRWQWYTGVYVVIFGLTLRGWIEKTNVAVASYPEIFGVIVFAVLWSAIPVCILIRVFSYGVIIQCSQDDLNSIRDMLARRKFYGRWLVKKFGKEIKS